MKLCTTLIAALMVFAVGLPMAHAAVIINDNFEYADQAAFQAQWTQVGAASVTSQAEQSVSPTKSAKIDTATAAQQQNTRTFPDTPIIEIGDQLVWSFNIREHNFVGNPQRMYVTLRDTTTPSGANQLISIGTNNTQTSLNSGGNLYMARILGHTPTTVDPNGGANEDVVGANGFFKLNDVANVALRTPGTTWRNLKLVLTRDSDNVGLNYNFYANNVLAETVNNIGTTAAATARQFDNIVIGSALSGSQTVYWDDMYLEHIPWDYKVTVGVDPLVNGGSFDFGTVYQNDPAPQLTLTLMNLGSAQLDLSNLMIDSPFAIVSAPANIAALGSGNIVLQMNTAQWGTFNGQFKFSTNLPTGHANKDFTVNLSGIVIPEPATFVLAGLGLMGIVVGARRRSS